MIALLLWEPGLSSNYFRIWDISTTDAAVLRQIGDLGHVWVTERLPSLLCWRFLYRVSPDEWVQPLDFAD